MEILGNITYRSNHGIYQGIIPRFFLHFEEMSKMAFYNDKDRKAIFHAYYEKNLDDFTNFYDSYNNIVNLHKEYIDGIISGLYFKCLANGKFSADKSPEVILKKNVQDFFRDGKTLINNFAKSKLLDDGRFELSKLLAVSPKNYRKAKESMLPNLKIKGYSGLFQIIEDAEKEFKKDFFLIRDDFEHNQFRVPDFQISLQNDTVHIVEPQIIGENVFKLIHLYYHKTFNFIETLAAYFFGLNACYRSKGIITLFYNNGTVDPANFRYRYKITIDVNDPDLDKLITF